MSVRDVRDNHMSQTFHQIVTSVLDKDLVIGLRKLDETTYKLDLKIVKNLNEFQPESKRTLLLIVEGCSLRVSEVEAI